MLHGAVCEHGFVRKALAQGPFARPLADQKAVIPLTAERLRHAHRVGDIHQITHGTKRQRVAVHVRRVQLNLAVFSR